MENKFEMQMFAVLEMDLQMFADTVVPASLVRKAWGKDLWTTAMKALYWNKFMGDTPDYIVQRMVNLKKEAGDRINIPLLLKLKEEGVMDDADVEGNEEALQFESFEIQVHEYAHAVRLKGKLEEQKTAIDLRKAAKTGLTVWLQEKIDRMIFEALTANPTPSRIVYAGGKTAENAITTTDTFTASLIGVAKRMAQMADPLIRPVMVEGKPHWVLILNPYQARDLKKDPEWREAQLNANVKGPDNPIFSGALGVYDNVVVHEHQNVARTLTGASNTPVGHALFVGAQAAGFAVAQETNWEEKSFNYNKRVGFETDTIIGIAKSVFNTGTSGEPVDFATIQIMTACLNDSGN